MNADRVMHTPGPWRAVDGRILPDNYVLEGAPIATVHARKKVGMQEANARLIAASPVMAAYLQELADAGDARASEIMESIHAAH